MVTIGRKTIGGGRESTWISRLLAYVEQEGLAETIKWTDPFGFASNSPPL